MEFRTFCKLFWLDVGYSLSDYIGSIGISDSGMMTVACWALEPSLQVHLITWSDEWDIFIKQAQTHKWSCPSFMLVSTLFDIDHDSESLEKYAVELKDVLPRTLMGNIYLWRITLDALMAHITGLWWLTLWPLGRGVCVYSRLREVFEMLDVLLCLSFLSFRPVLPLPSNRYSVIHDTWPTRGLRETVDISDQDYSSALKITRVAVCLLGSWGDGGGVRCKQPASP